MNNLLGLRQIVFLGKRALLDISGIPIQRQDYDLLTSYNLYSRIPHISQFCVVL